MANLAKKTGAFKTPLGFVLSGPGSLVCRAGSPMGSCSYGLQRRSPPVNSPIRASSPTLSSLDIAIVGTSQRFAGKVKRCVRQGV